MFNPQASPDCALDTRQHGPSVVICNTGQRNLDYVMDELCAHLDRQNQLYQRIASHEDLPDHLSTLADARVIAGFGAMRIDAALIAQAPKLRGVVSCVSGTEGIDIAAATAAGVLVAHAPTPENFRSMAEATVLLILQLMYDLDGTRANARLQRERPLSLRAQMLYGKTVGIVGWGRIAKTVATLLAPFGVNLLIYSRQEHPQKFANNALVVSMQKVMSESDVVCVLAGVSSGQPPLVTSEMLSLLKSGAYFINLSRGSAVDEDALTKVLQSGRIAGAALDVFIEEPLPPESALWECPNTIITPHQIGHTRESDASLLPAILNNVDCLLEGRVPPMVRNSTAVEAWMARWSRSEAA